MRIRRNKKILTIRTPKISTITILKIKDILNAVTDLKDGGMTNSVDSNQTAPLGAV